MKLDFEPRFKTIIEDNVTGKEKQKIVATKKDYPKVLRKINSKYKLNLIITPREKRKDRDLEWAM